jgi:membrane protein YdbS with pleckstrin-like domain
MKRKLRRVASSVRRNSYRAAADIEPKTERRKVRSVAKVTREKPRTIPDRLAWYDREFSLSELFPLDLRFTIRKSVPWLVASAAGLLSFLVCYGWEALGTMETPLQQFHYAVVRITLVVLLARFIYWEIYRRSFSYKTEGFRLLIARGVFIKMYGSLPLLPVTELVLKRDPLDLMFGLYNLHVVVPAESGDHLGVIEGLNERSAFGLQRFLSEQLSTQTFVPDAALDVMKESSAIVAAD